MMTPTAMFFWRKVDHPGHDSCRLFKLSDGWSLSGAAVFWDEGMPCHFRYEVSADGAWRTRSASVSGFLGKKAIDLSIRSVGAGEWQVNGVSKKSVRGCVDVDLGFTPATNRIALRRLSLKVGQRAEAPAAYLEFPEMRLVMLPQTYLRIGPTEYEYEAPTVGYSGTLSVLASGAVINYPGLFELVTSG
ncbi:MAG: putative glycolipid-binding domain-containing protein [Desulfomonile tiedjei]|nr:putative glycolipid-binding domain-containing protein [Desulfomonile tiedjei]